MTPDEMRAKAEEVEGDGPRRDVLTLAAAVWAVGAEIVERQERFEVLEREHVRGQPPPDPGEGEES